MLKNLQSECEGHKTFDYILILTRSAMAVAEVL